jgi:hypothetical protein
MAESKAALISIDEICTSWLLKKGKSFHSWWKILPIASEAVQELSLTSLPIVQHVELTKSDNENYFVLPKGFTDWVSVGVRIGDRWRPVAVSERLMPYPDENCGGGQFNGGFSNGFKRRGDWKKWLNTECKFGTADFFDSDFLEDDFSITDTVIEEEGVINPFPDAYGAFFPFNYGMYDTNAIGELVQGHFTNRLKGDEVTFNVNKGVVMCPDDFPVNSLYLVYVGIGTADTMTYIPIKAQAAIEAYIDWKYAQNKRGGLAEARGWKMLYDEQHRLLRSRLNRLTTTVVRRIVDRGYQIGGSWNQNNNFISSTNRGSGAGNNVYTPTIKFFTGYASAGTTFTDYRMINRTIAFVIVNSIFKNSGYNLVNDTLIFTDGTTFVGGESIAVYYE